MQGLTVIQAGYSSAYAIGGTPEEKFLADVKSVAPEVFVDSALDLKLLSDLRAHAQIIKARNQRLSVAMAHFVRGSGIAACDNFSSISDREAVLDAMLESNNPKDGGKSSDFVFEIDDYNDSDSLSMVGPAAYLVEILNFLPDQARTKLLNKRPDIAEIELTNENITVELPYIDLANEVMESYIQNLDKQSLGASVIAAFNTAPDSESLELIEAPQTILNPVYQMLQRFPSPHTFLPFNIGLATQRAYLPLLKTSRQELLWMFRDESRYRTFLGISGPDSPNDVTKLKEAQTEVIQRATNAETLGLSHADFVIVTKESYWSQRTWELQQPDLNPDADSATQLQPYHAAIGLPTVAATWGYATSDDMQSTSESIPNNRRGLHFAIEAFLPRSGLTMTDFVSLANTEFIGTLMNSKYVPSWAGVDSGTLLSPLTMEDEGWDQIQIFLRLAKRSGLSFEALDECVKALVPDEPNHKKNPFSPRFIAELATMKRIMDSTGLDVLSLLNFFRPMSIVGDHTLWSRLFMKRNVLRFDSAFENPDPTSGPPLKDHLAILLVAISCSPAAFVAISRGLPAVLQSPDKWQKLSLFNIHSLHRCVTLAQAAGVPVEQACDFINVFPECFTSPDKLEKSLKSWTTLSDAGLSLAQLLQILNSTDFQAIMDSASEVASLKIVSGLHSDLLAAHKKYPKQSSALLSIQDLKQLSCSLFPIDVVEVYFRLIEQTLPTSEVEISITISDEQSLRTTLPSNLQYIPKLAGQAAVLKLQGLLSQDGLRDAIKILSDHGSHAAGLSPLMNELSQRADKQAHLSLQAVPSSSRLPDLETILLSGDDVPHDTITPNKTIRFQTYLFGTLRASMENKALSSAFEPILKFCDEEMLLFLLKNVTALQPGANVVEELHGLYTDEHATSTAHTPWAGFFNPPSSGDYTFVSEKQRTTDLTIDGRSYAWSADSVTQKWYTQKVALSAKNFYNLTASDGSVTYRKSNPLGSNTGLASFVSLEILRKIQQISLVLQRLDIVIGAFGLTLDEIDFLIKNRVAIGLDPLHPKLDDLVKLATVMKMRGTCQSVRKSSLQNPLMEILKWAMRAGEPSLAEAVSEICDITGWDDAIVEALIPVVTANKANEHPGLAFQDFALLRRLFGLVALTTRYDIDSVTLDVIFGLAEPVADVITPTSDMDVADGFAKALRRHFGDEAWDQIVAPVNNVLRQQRRDALIAYLLQLEQIKAQGVTDANDLFEFFLVDVQMGVAPHTSRIKQAISVVQVFIQKALQNPNVSAGDDFGQIDAQGWERMKIYTVWAANIKIQLFPENWLSASLLDVKSPGLTSLESTIKKGGITWDGAEAAFVQYLHTVNDIAHLQYVAQCSQQTGTEPETLHVFGCTTHTPPKFHYRRKDMVFGWTNWEPIDLSIVTFDSDRSHGLYRQAAADKTHGCFIVPYTYKSRLLVFLPQFTKMEWPGQRADDGKYRKMTWNISLDWSEYRNGLWTLQKTLPASIPDLVRPEKLFSSDTSASPAPIETYIFRARPTDTAHITVEVLKQYWWSELAEPAALVPDASAPRVYKVGEFTIDPTSFQCRSSTSSGDDVAVDVSQMGLTNQMVTFHQQADGFVYQSEQSQANFSADEQPKIFNRIDLYSADKEKASRIISNGQTQLLAHLDADHLLEEALSSDVGFDSILTIDQKSSRDGDLNSPMAAPYSAYDWETGVFIPMLFVDVFLDAQQFDYALKMIRYVYNPLNATAGSAWAFYPFHNLDNITSPDTALNILKTQDTALRTVENTPFDPHAVARSRISAYMKWIVMKYIQILTMYGDYYFRQNTLESIPEAILCYVEASHWRGPQEQLLPHKKRDAPAKFSNIQALESNFVLDFESGFVDLKWLVADKDVYTGFSTVDTKSLAYFGILHNEKVSTLRETIDDRLFKIRNSLNINGNLRTLALFEPPIDPGLLVQAAAGGSLNLSNTLTGLDAPLSHVRFSKLLDTALGVCYDLRLFWASLLAAKQSKDAEALATLQAQQSSSTQTLALEMKNLAVEQAQKTADALTESRKEPEGKFRYFANLLGLQSGDKVPEQGTKFEELQSNNAYGAADGNAYAMSDGEIAATAMNRASIATMEVSSVISLAGAFAALFPTIGAVEEPFGLGLEEHEGGLNVAEAAKLTKEALEAASEIVAKEGEAIKQFEEYKERCGERLLEYNEAGLQLMAIDSQIEIQETVLKLAQQDKDNTNKSIQAAAALEAFLKSKYSNEELYSWLQSTLQNLYYQVYTIVYDMAQKAEQVYRFELGIDQAASKIIDFGYWDVTQSGALAGEKLYVGLRKLEQAYQETRAHDFEIKKKISLRQIDPLALYQLRAQGSCTFWVPELVFDMDFPGQYKRRIKTVSLSLPTSTGGQLSATLTLMEHKYRTSTVLTGSGGYFEAPGDLDVRFRKDNIPINAIAVSESDSQDAGVFNLDFGSDTFFPFEGAGAVSKWSLEISEFSQLDPASITDAVIQMQYTSSNGAGPFKDSVSSAINTALADRAKGLTTLFDLPTDLLPSSQGWINATETAAPNGVSTQGSKRELSLAGLPTLFPFFARSSRNFGKITISAASLITKIGSTAGDDNHVVKFSLTQKQTNVETLFNAVAVDAAAGTGANSPSITQWVANINGSLTLQLKGVEKDSLVLLVDGYDKLVNEGVWLLLTYSLTK